MTLSRLIARCEKATEGSRELDCAIRLTVEGDVPYGIEGPPNHPRPGSLARYVGTYRDVISADDAIPDHIVPRYTSSVDAVLELIERVSPEAHWSIHSPRYARQWEGVIVTEPLGRVTVFDKAPSAALALLTACLRAIAAKEG